MEYGTSSLNVDKSELSWIKLCVDEKATAFTNRLRMALRRQYKFQCLDKLLASQIGSCLIFHLLELKYWKISEVHD